MALGDVSNPTRFLGGQVGTTNRELALDIFGGEVLTAFDLAVQFPDKVFSRTISGGLRSARFPKVWKATAEYHTPGTEMLGNDIETSEITITVDDILVSHVAISDLDEILSHFDVRGQFTTELGRALARIFDKNTARALIKAARTAADGPFPGGNSIVDAACTNTGTIDGVAWINRIRKANLTFFDNDIPEEQARYLAVNAAVFDAIKWAKDANGNYLILNRDFGHGGAGGLAKRAETMELDGVTIIKSRNLPKTDETADTSVYSKYRGNYATTTGIMWTPMAVGTLKLMDVSLETTRDTRRLEDFIVAKMLAGSGALRPECAYEIKTA
jgi:hypothetical protein